MTNKKKGRSLPQAAKSKQLTAGNSLANDQGTIQPNDSPIDHVLAQLEGVKRSGDSWIARCPAHDDRNPSLAVSVGADGKVLIRCHAGCESEAVIDAIGLDWSDLFPCSRSATRRCKKAEGPKATFPSAEAAVKWLTTKRGRCAGQWAYASEKSERVACVARFDHTSTADGSKPKKTFVPISKRDNGWVIGDPDGEWPLYRLPHLCEAETIYVTEGEKAADAGALALSIATTTSAHGSQSPHKTDWSPVAGKEVIILPDNDDAGRKYATKVIEELSHVKPSPSVFVLKLPDLPEGGDIVEFIEKHGGDLAEARRQFDALVPEPVAIDQIPRTPQTYIGPVGLSLKPISARAVGKQGKIEMKIEVLIGTTPHPPLTLTTVASNWTRCARQVCGWIQLEHGPPINGQLEEIKQRVEMVFAELVNDAEEILEWSMKREAKEVQKMEGQTIQSIVIDEAPRQLRIVFREDDGKLWSESESRAIDYREFKELISPDLLKACQAACDYPLDRMGRSAPVGTIKQYLPVAYASCRRRLPREVDAELGPDSSAALRYWLAVEACFNHAANWKWRDGERASEAVTLAGLARSKFQDFTVHDPPNHWLRLHNSSIDAWFLCWPIAGAGGSAAEKFECWLAMSWLLPFQLLRSGGRINLPNTKSHVEFSRLMAKYGLSQSDTTPSLPSVEDGCEHVVLSRSVCNQLISPGRRRKKKN